MLRNDVDVVEVGDRWRESFRLPHRHLLRDLSNGRRDLGDDHLVQVRVGRRPRQQQDWPSPYGSWKVSPPNLVLPHRSPGAPRPSQTVGSNAASGLSGRRAYASAVACSSASHSAFKIAARTNSDRRRERAGATRSKRSASSSSTSTRSDFIGWSIYSIPQECPPLRTGDRNRMPDCRRGNPCGCPGPPPPRLPVASLRELLQELDGNRADR